MLDLLALFESATLSGGILLAALLTTFVGGVLITYLLMKRDARALFALIRPKNKNNDDKEAPSGEDGRSTRIR